MATNRIVRTNLTEFWAVPPKEVEPDTARAPTDTFRFHGSTTGTFRFQSDGPIENIARDPVLAMDFAALEARVDGAMRRAIEQDLAQEEHDILYGTGRQNATPPNGLLVSSPRQAGRNSGLRAARFAELYGMGPERLAALGNIRIPRISREAIIEMSSDMADSVNRFAEAISRMAAPANTAAAVIAELSRGMARANNRHPMIVVDSMGHLDIEAYGDTRGIIQLEEDGPPTVNKRDRNYYTERVLPPAPAPTSLISRLVKRIG